MGFPVRLIMEHILLRVAILLKQSIALESLLHRPPKVIMLHHTAHDVVATSLFPFSLHFTCECQVARRIRAIDVDGAFVGFFPKLDLRLMRGELL